MLSKEIFNQTNDRFEKLTVKLTTRLNTKILILV